MAKGKIIELYNNFGRIITEPYNSENELIPFLVEGSMLETIEGKQFIKYTDEVEFELSNNQGVRGRDIKEAIKIRFIGKRWEYQERKFEDSFNQIIRKRLDEYNFYYPELNDMDFEKWLEENNFQPRMIEYLSPGLFTPKEILKLIVKSDVDLENPNEKFKVNLLFLIDRIDIEFRKNIMSWITNIENCYKSYLKKVSISDEGEDIGRIIVTKWIGKKTKIKKLIKRAKNKRMFRNYSNDFDYLKDENFVPLFDLMEQLELSELTELIALFYDEYSKKANIPDILNRMKECSSFINNLCAIRNAAAHGRSIIPDFMDPDYNGNWDLEFDDAKNRCTVENWTLYNLLCDKWKKMGLGEYSKKIINTLYGNPIRRAWVEMHYIYFYIVSNIEKTTFDLFKIESAWFLSKDENISIQIKNVNLCNLRLSDMGNTTFNFSTTPYDEIAQEAYAIWELF